MGFPEGAIGHAAGCVEVTQARDPDPVGPGVVIRQKLDCAEPGRNGGLLNASRSPATTADRALQDIIDDLQSELDQVTGEESHA